MKRLIEIVRSFGNRRMLVIGDAIADQFLHGNISRVSREAPVFILKHEQTQTVPGGAANCAMNLASLGARVSLISAVGNDQAGRDLRALLENSGIDVSGVIVSDKIKTTTKVRILAGLSHSNKQQVIRIDYDDLPLRDDEPRDSIVNALKNALPFAEAVVISDYDYGVVGDRELALLRESTSKPVLVDSRRRLGYLKGFTAATPNEDEVEQIAGHGVDGTLQLEIAARSLKNRNKLQALLVTRGPQGMMLLEGDEAPLYIPAVGSQQAVDVTGAGDTVIATFALGVASGASFPDSAHLANHAGGLVVMKRGTATVSVTELEHSILNAEND